LTSPLDLENFAVRGKKKKKELLAPTVGLAYSQGSSKQKFGGF
jgi:hypothetical protein